MLEDEFAQTVSCSLRKGHGLSAALINVDHDRLGFGNATLILKQDLYIWGQASEN